jgi:hypothetical protein
MSTMSTAKLTRTEALALVWGDNTRRAETRALLSRWMTPRGIRLAMRMVACDPTRCGDGPWACPFCCAADCLAEYWAAQEDRRHPSSCDTWDGSTD